ncbi:MAG: esterase-like activity of phytase family protein [Bacteroidia bacterium]
MKNSIKLTTVLIVIGIISSCNSVDVDGDSISTSLDYSSYETFGKALADQIIAGDGAGIDGTFRNSGTVIDESNNTYYGVNGVHPVNSGDYTSYYPKSIVQASLDNDEIVKAYSFDGHNGHEVDMEALTYGPDNGSLYVGDEYNYIYRLNLETGAIEMEWDLADIGVSTNTDKGIEALTYSPITGNFYAGIQDDKNIVEIKLADDGSVTKVKDIPVSDSPSGLFAHEDGTLYVLTFGTIYRFTTDGTQNCSIEIPNGLGMTRPDGIFIDSKNEYIYLADSQGPLNNGYSLYKIAWTAPCD